MTFLTLFVLCCLGLGSHSRKNKIKIILSLLQLLLVKWISTIWIGDVCHHTSNVIIRLMLGTVCVIVLYHLWHPSVFSTHPGTSSCTASVEADRSDTMMVGCKNRNFEKAENFTTS